MDGENKNSNFHNNRKIISISKSETSLSNLKEKESGHGKQGQERRRQGKGRKGKWVKGNGGRGNGEREMEEGEKNWLDSWKKLSLIPVDMLINQCLCTLAGVHPLVYIFPLLHCRLWHKSKRHHNHCHQCR